MRFLTIWLLVCALFCTGSASVFAAENDPPKSASSADEKTTPAKRPNIVFIMSDDHAAHAVSAYSDKLIKTPHIDRLAKEGMKFDNCFVTNSICTPSRAVILTGKYSHLNGVPVFNHIDNAQPQLGKYLHEAGYYTGVIGKWHLGGNVAGDPTLGAPAGFDYWNILPGQGAYKNPEFIEMGKHKKMEGYVTNIITDLSIEFIKNRPADKPFFLMYHHKAPHRGWQPDEKYKEQYKDYVPPIPESFDDDYKGKSDASKRATLHIDKNFSVGDVKGKPPEGLSEKERKMWFYTRYMQDYLACVQSVDDNVGRFLYYLDKSGLAENTIVVYTSDQGFFLGEHNFYDKRFMYEESLRSPLLVRWPEKIKPGSVNKDMVLNLDFAATLMDAAGLKVPSDMQGRSFLPLLRGEKVSDWRTSMYYRYYHNPGHHNVAVHYGVRNQRYKLIFFNRLKQWELYDLEKDPHEMHNIYNDPESAKIVEEMKAELYRLKKEFKDDDQFADKLPKDDAF